MDYTVKQLADQAGISVRTLHHYDRLGLLQPSGRSTAGYRRYDEAAAIKLQQILFFRELDFPLGEIKTILSNPDFDVLAALHLQQALLRRKAERIERLLETVAKTIKNRQGELKMSIKDYYQGLDDATIEKYRREVRDRWGEKALAESEKRVMKMGKTAFAALQAEGGVIFQTIAENMAEGHQSPVVQRQVVAWRGWLENFAHYPDEAALGLGRAYSQSPDFAAFFHKFHADLPAFLTRAIEYHCQSREHTA